MRADLLFSIAFTALVALSSLASANQAEQVRNSVPRFGGQKEFSESDSDYWTGIAAIAIVCIVLAALSLLCLTCWCLCRCCMWKCFPCCNDKRTRSQSRMLPALVGLIIMMVSFAFIVVGQDGNTKLNETMADEDQDSDSFVVLVPKLLDDVVEFAENLLVPVDDLIATVRSQATLALGVINATAPILADSSNDVVQSISALGAYSDLEFTSGSTTYSCDACSGLGTRLTDSSNQITSLTSDGVSKLQSTVDSTDSELTSKIDDIEDKVSEFKDTLNDDVLDRAEDYKKDSADYTDYIKDYDESRYNGTVILFLLPLIAFVLTALGFLCKSSKLYFISSFVMYLSMFFMFLLLAVHLPLSVVVSDSCVYVEKEEKTLPDRTEDHFKVMQACLDGSRLVDALDKADALNFTNINFQGFDDLDEALNFTLIDDVFDDLGTVNYDTFGYDPAVGTASLADTNSRTSPDFFTRDNYTLIVVTDYPSGDQTAIEETIAFLDAEKQMDEVIFNITRDKNNVQTSVSQFKADLREANANITGIQSLIQPIVDDANDILDEGRCVFLGTFYRKLKKNSCEKMLDAVTAIALAMFFVGLLGVPFLWVNAWLPNDDSLKEDPEAIELDELHGGADDDDYYPQQSASYNQAPQQQSVPYNQAPQQQYSTYNQAPPQQYPATQTAPY